jgi:hypothetical protein
LLQIGDVWIIYDQVLNGIDACVSVRIRAIWTILLIIEATIVDSAVRVGVRFSSGSRSWRWSKVHVRGFFLLDPLLGLGGRQSHFLCSTKLIGRVDQLLEIISLQVL